MGVNFSEAGAFSEPSLPAAAALVCRAIKASVGTPELSVCRKSLRDHVCPVSMSNHPPRDPARRIFPGVYEGDTAARVNCARERRYCNDNSCERSGEAGGAKSCGPGG